MFNRRCLISDVQSQFLATLQDFRTLAGIVFKHLEDATGPETTRGGLAARLGHPPVHRGCDPRGFRGSSEAGGVADGKGLLDSTRLKKEDGSGLRILRSIGLLGGAPVLEVSDLQTDRNQLHRSQIVNEIRRAAEREGTCIITDFDEVLDGFYDLLNLRFQRIQLGDQMNLAATVASGSYSVLTPVHPRFQLVVSIKASDLEQTPLPFLNRFEKFYLTLADVASFKAFDLCHGQISHQMLQNYILQPVRDRLEELVQLIGPASLIGYRAATMDSAILETLQNQEVSEALVKLAATWQDRGSIAARGPRKFESESTGSLPGDLSERQLADIQQQKALSRMRCHGFQNAGSTCYLQACLVLLTLHENLWLGKSDSTISKTLHDIMKRSRLNTVSMEPVMLLEQELKQVGIVAGRQQEDAATTLEGLLDHCGGLKLPLRTETRALPSHDLEDAAVKVLPQAESSEYVLRVPLQGVPRLELLLSAAVQAQVAADTELETETLGRCGDTSRDVTGTLKLPAGSALRMKQRLEGQLPPRLLPICLERWSISGSLMQKNQVQLFVPLEGLELPLLAPSQGRLLVESSECWTYNLRSFVVHIGRTLDSGHYVTYWRSQDGWIEINDASERSIDATTAERKAGDAYLLIYELAGYQGVRTLSGHIPGKQETLRQHQLDAVAAIALGAAGRLMNLAPSEAVLSNMKSLPQELLRGYVLRPHTGLGSLLTHMAHMDCVDRGPRCLVFTRDVLGLHDPLQREDAEIQAMPRSRQEAIALLESRRGKGKPLMVLCRLGATNGGDVECTHRGIDQLRRLADDRDVQGLVVVLLLPPWKLHVAACYQAVFMQSWQIFHLDSLDDSESPGLVSSLLERSEERSSPILHHAVSTVPGGSTPATPSGHSFTTPVTTPVTASVTAPIHSSAEHAELYRDLWTAVGYLTPSESLRSFAEEWLHPAAAFYRADASLQQRVEPLWALLSSPSFKVLLDHLQRIRSEGLYGVSLEQEATVVAQEIMGMKVNQNRPMLCLQTVVRNKCVEKLVSVLAAALRVFCDQGGLKQLVELGNDAVSVTEAYLQMRFASQDAWPAKLTAVFLMPSSNNQYLTCFADLFEKLQECFLDVKAESPSRELQEMLQHTTAAWSKHPFCEVSERVANSGAMHASYCSYLAECLGLPKSAAKLLSKAGSIQGLEF
ncbi:Putative uncharacterized transmembrane protein DDB_G0290641 [Durusdinium trenchii]|uniref:Uncharacterized transmembrane protein DDB_G0290641 n=1 Tax=Durusdinium trenchii TaxID=1381693 RepID=A0ABP0L085_9DINO